MTASARPPAFVRNADGILSVSGMSLLDIAAQHGAPLYVYSATVSAVITSVLPMR